MPDWLKFFDKTIERLQEPFAMVLLASGCREAWLQAELFRAGRDFDLRVNEYRLGKRMTADLSHGHPVDMLAEIKIVGANYQSKMRWQIESDVERMKAFSSPGTERFMILVIPRSEKRNRLHDFLHSCSFSDRCIEREWPAFKLRVWQF